MTEQLVSIIINNYNYARFLPEAIESALSQREHHAEVIVVDDGSVDNSRQIISSYGERVTAVCKENGGQASALNAGFAHCRGGIVIFLDADDRLRPEACRRVAQAFRADPGVAKVMYRMAVIDAMGQETGVTKPDPHLPLLSGDLRRHLFTFPFDMTWMPTSGNAFPARVLQAIFPLPEAAYGAVGADWYLAYLSLLYGTVRFLPEICADYRVHGGNNYEMAGHTLDFEHIRRTIHYARVTQRYLGATAVRLGVRSDTSKTPETDSVSILAQRLISLRLDSPRHPVAGDTAWRLGRLAVAASLRRFDVVWPTRILFVMWFLAMTLAPRPVAWALAEQFLFPAKRGRINAVLQSWP